ncbi:MAG TPA: DegQ family serine endoprotease [Candidatus Binataceae bacterium]|nr:DegQ family serine endoprotease [Candidatus Binataceae bacterium]
MAKKVAAIGCGVVLGLLIAFARAGAFWSWGDSSSPANASAASSPHAATMAEAQPAQPNTPEPNERAGVPSSFAPLVKRVMPTVVNVAVVEDVKATGMPYGEMGPDEGGGGGDEGEGPEGGDPFEQFRRFFGQIPREFKQKGLGSGVIVSPDGYILTNNHVAGSAEEIHVTLMDKREFTARVVGKDPKTDLALIKIDTKDQLPAADLGDSDKTQVGDWVVAIGNPFGFSLTVTAGIVSAKGRFLGNNYDDYLQTDASINPGNSGGPLFNTDGQVIGINSAIYTRTGTNNGIGFAIPIDMARNVMEQLRKNGRVIRGWLGVEIQEVTADLAQSFGLPRPEGALVAGVDKNSPAEAAGIERGDIITKFDGKSVDDEHMLSGYVAQTPVNRKVEVDLLRNGKPKTLEVTIAELKEQQVASAKSEEPGGSWGMQVTDLNAEIAQQFHLDTDKGVVIRNVEPDSPAQDAGLQPGDIVLEINHDKVSTVKDFVSKAAEAKTSGKPALLLVQRNGSTMYTVIKGNRGEG